MAENDVNRLIDMLYERVEDAKSPALKPNLSMVDGMKSWICWTSCETRCPWS